MYSCRVLFPIGDFSYSRSDFSLSQVISYCGIAPLSVISEVVLLYFYATQPHLRASPGDLVLWQMLSQLVLDIGWLYSGYRYVSNGYMIDNPACHSVAVASIYAIVVVSCSNVVLAIEILVKLSRPFNEGQHKRKIVYMLGIHSIACAVALVASSLDAVGVTSSNKCFFNIEDQAVSVIAPYASLRIATIGAFTMLELGLLVAMLYALFSLRTATPLQRAILIKLVAFVLTSVVLEMAFPGYLIMMAIGYFVQEHYGINGAQSTQNEIETIMRRWEVRR